MYTCNCKDIYIYILCIHVTVKIYIYTKRCNSGFPSPVHATKLVHDHKSLASHVRLICHA